MKDDDQLSRLMRQNGWRLVRARKHHVWRCPCGEHQVVSANSGSDSRRGVRNKRAQLRRMGCPSLDGLL